MIDARELRKGDLLSCYGETILVDEIGRTGINYSFMDEDYEHYFEDLYPIQITEELLLKLGFEKENCLNQEDDYRLVIGKFFVSLSLYSKYYKEWRLQIDDMNNTSMFGGIVQNLHQLQNAIYFATKEELDVSPIIDLPTTKENLDEFDVELEKLSEYLRNQTCGQLKNIFKMIKKL